MYLEFVLLIILIRFIRKDLRTATEMPEWDKLLFKGMIVSIACMLIELVIHSSRPITFWIAQGMFFTLAYLSYNRKEFRNAKSLINAFLPLVIVIFCTYLVQLSDNHFYKKWSNVFETANLFAVIWMIAMLIINNKQRKALEKERLKTLEKEKEIQITEKIKAQLEIQVTERTAALTMQKEELQLTLDELKSTQTQLIHAEKMASLGELTAGIAHEIQNPLNFVNNFSEVNAELITEMKEELSKGNIEEAKAIADDINDNEQKIIFHGKRADAIVKGMLQHSRSSTGTKEPTDINVLADEYFRLAYHGLRAKDKSFNAAMKSDYDKNIGEINIIPQDIGRVILNLITNAFYAVTEKKKQQEGYDPTVSVSTKREPDRVLITVKDNANGIPQKVLDKIFQPFFTTKPTGEGTGLGLSLSYDIIKAHAGELKVETKEGIGSSFIISLPA